MNYHKVMDYSIIGLTFNYTEESVIVKNISRHRCQLCNKDQEFLLLPLLMNNTVFISIIFDRWHLITYFSIRIL